MADQKFKLVSDFQPQGDQPKAIEHLAAGLRAGCPWQTLLGVTGSGKTFTMAKVIEQIQRPTLIISHNKTLAAQLCAEFRSYFPENAVEYFVSYYDYYQPEAYIPQTDTYIAKDMAINDEIDRLRHSATRSLLERQDVIVVASVSCIYGLGLPEDYLQATIQLKKGQSMKREQFLQKLIAVKYERNDLELKRSTFRVRGEIVDIWPAYEETIIRIHFGEESGGSGQLGEQVAAIQILNTTTGEVEKNLEQINIYPGTHYVTFEPRLEAAFKAIEKELAERLEYFKKNGKLLEAQRLESRTKYDLEMMREIGYCSGIENYSRHLSGRAAGQPPGVLLDFFPEDFLMFIDESHATIPQIGGMYAGDRSRKNTLVDFGFRLPSAIDNRPLDFNEFLGHLHQVVCVSATPAEYELKESARSAALVKKAKPITVGRGVLIGDPAKLGDDYPPNGVAEQVIRPTGLVDPEVTILPTSGQIKDLIVRIKERVKNTARVLVTTLTKRMAEDLTDYLTEHGLRVRYLHSDVDTLDRIDLLRDLRLGNFDVLVGINLLREGLDLPEVSLVAILDADKEGFLRSQTSLIQTMGRAARNVKGEVVLYADNITGSIKRALDEVERRRKIQIKYNEEHDITPQTIVKAIKDIRGDSQKRDELKRFSWDDIRGIPPEKIPDLLADLQLKMKEAAQLLDFEKAAQIRDMIKDIERGAWGRLRPKKQKTYKLKT